MMGATVCPVLGICREALGSHLPAVDTKASTVASGCSSRELVPPTTNSWLPTDATPQLDLREPSDMHEQTRSSWIQLARCAKQLCRVGRANTGAERQQNIHLHA